VNAVRPIAAISMDIESTNKQRSAIFFSFILLITTYSAIEFAAWEAIGSSDDDGDGLTYGLEFYINTLPSDWDTDNDGLPDGWEWQYGLDPLSPSGLNGSTGDPDLDSLTNLNEYQYSMPSNWDSASTPNALDNGVWWNGTVPVSNWDEESAMQLIQGLNSDGADEDPPGNICLNNFDDDYDGLVDNWDSDKDGDADCSSNDDDGDNMTDEDPNGWDTDGDGMPDGWEVANGLDPTSSANDDGGSGDPDNDGLVNLYEYVNPAWDTRNGTLNPPTQYWQPGPNSVGGSVTNTESPCNPVQNIGPNGCQIFTAEVDGITYTDPNNNDTDGDGLNDSYEALVLLTDPTAIDTDGDGITDGVEVFASYGNPPQASDPRNNNTDGDQFDDGEEDLNGNGIVDDGETDPTRIEDSGDIDGDGIQNWEENMTCTQWNNSDTDGGGVNDGLELAAGHFTDPCMSTFEIYLDVISWVPTGSILTVNNTSLLDPNPVDWRQNNAPMAWFESGNGNRTGFRYSSISGNNLISVDITMPPDALYVVVLNGSWCWQTNPPPGGNAQHCDDDYQDTDGDGLADWEENLGSWGYFSDFTLSDTDGDGVNDLDEILNSTDPLEPCDNLADFDGDGLNNWFENNTGCALSYGIEGGNATFDNYTTLWNNTDTDNGGVDDYQEYIDGTNPQNNPSDDLNPVDTDGDGIPDTIEQQIGTDWRDPDTDGGGIPDGDECLPAYWENNCLDSDNDPWNASDDIVTNQLYFQALNSTSGVDYNLTHYWRWHTYDYYTGVSWGVNTSLVGNTPMSPSWSTTQGIAHPDFWDKSSLFDWQLNFNPSLSPGRELIAPYNAVNFTDWVDVNSGLNFSNYSRDVLIDSSSISTLYVTAPQVILNSQIRENTTAFTGSSYAKDLPKISSAGNITEIAWSVVNETGFTSTWDQVVAIQDFLINGNDTITFLRNHDGSNRSDLPPPSLLWDTSLWIIESAFEGDCNEYATVFAALLQALEIPTRKVTGFSGGTWVDNGFELYGDDFTWWVEVHLQTNANQGELDLGWIPFEACPNMSIVEVVNEQYNPDTIDRDNSTGNITLNGTLQFVNNASEIEGIVLELYLVPQNETSNIPGSAANAANLIGSSITNSTGFFEIIGTSSEIMPPGYGSLVLLTKQKGYVGTQSISFPWTINVTDDVNLTIPVPILSDEPILGAGVNTTVTGSMNWENDPLSDPSQLDNLQVLLNYTTVIDGDVNLISEIGAGGYFEFIVPISEDEPLGLINATIAFLGWHQDDLNNATPSSYHLRPSSVEFNFNITPSPNLTVVLEGSAENNSILDINQPIFVNGTALSQGSSPLPLNGTLYLEMRRSGTNGPYLNIATWNLNDSNWTSQAGQFAIILDFNESIVNIPAGEIEVKFTYVADGLLAADEELFTSDYGIRSYLNFSYSLNAVPRGGLATVEVQLSDHTGTSVTDFIGDYWLDFNGIREWNTSNPITGQLQVNWLPMDNMTAGNYDWNLTYNGSTWLLPNVVNDTVRIQGRANVTVSIGQDWTHIGGSNWISGFAQDIVLLTPITGNNSSIVLQLETPSDLPPQPDGSPAPPVLTRLADGWINTTTGSYNISFNMPSNIGSGVYQLRLSLDFSVDPPRGGEYFTIREATTLPTGIESDFVLDSSTSNLIVVAGSILSLNATVSDIADDSLIPNATAVLYFDWGGSNQTALDTSISDADGIVRFNPTLPANTTPGFYDLRIHAPDDLTDDLDTPNAGRWIQNETFSNLTVQVNSLVEIDSIPNEVTAGQSFSMTGRVLDGFDSNRTVTGPMAVKVFFLGDDSETLVESYTTANNGSFTVSVPTDPFGDGVTSGTKTVVVSVVNGSTPFYLTGSGNASLLVKGVTRFTDRTPLIQTIVDRGTNITFGARLTEFSDNDRRLGNLSVAAKFHETWLNEQTSSGDGLVNFTFSVPHNHPLGQIPVRLWFNGSSTLHETTLLLTTIIVRSPTTLTIDPISENPIAGQSLNISGELLSSNLSGIMDRSGNSLSTFLTFEINGETSGFQVTGGVVDPNGSWSGVITLSLSFPRGTHNLSAFYTPSVNYYGSSAGVGVFDSRGFSQIMILDPADLDPDRRVIRGDSISVNLSLIDNAGQLVENASIGILVDDILQEVIQTDDQGRSNVQIQVPSTRIQGPLTITANFTGISGSTGLIGDTTWTRVIVLAPTVLEITQTSGSMIAGESVTFGGTLLDEHGMILTDDGNPTGGIIHLEIDGIDVGASYTTRSGDNTGIWNITYDIPLDSNYGPHSATVSFLGGFTWVDPMGQGDSLNPEYYLPSEYTVSFNVIQTSQVVLTTPPGEIDRNELLLIEGLLTDGAGRVIGDRNLEVTLNDQFLTGVQVESNGSFSIYIPVPPDMPLGPRILEISFDGEEFILPSNSTTVFTVFGPTVIYVNPPESVAVGDQLRLTGTVKDNLPDGWLSNHSLEIFIDGTLVGLTTTNEDGEWFFNWVVSDFLDVGFHTVTISSPGQGYYRPSSIDTNLTIAYHTSIELDLEVDSVTRGGVWNFTGRLFDSDTTGSPGLSGRTISVVLDGEELTTIETGNDGEFVFQHELGYQISRGAHDIHFIFDGETFYLPFDNNMTVYVKADIEIEILWRNEVVIRSDDSASIKLVGRVIEIGGEENLIDGLDIVLLWNGAMEPASIKWDSATGHFEIDSPARSTMPAGEITLIIQVLPDAERFINGGSISHIVNIRVPVQFEFNPDGHTIRENTRLISGNITVRSTDTGMPVEGISLVTQLVNGTSIRFQSVKLTDSSGAMDYEFLVQEPIPTFYDKDYWGELGLIFSTDSQLIDPNDRFWLSNEHNGLNMTYTDPESRFNTMQIIAITGILLILLAVVGMGISLQRRRKAALDEIQSVFSYTAELLAAGDEVREAIFNCYESLCQILMRNGFLRRDFETVREFEMAIRKALQISEQALIALDRIFEEARYSSHRLGEGHRENAQLALQTVLQEIDQLQEVPEREEIDSQN
tara:strand:+ start:28376 stop:37318 length:8943 start_codon:yes stop_codon:yes gene_type:complete